MSKQFQKTILILGGSVMQLPAIHIAKQLGWRVVVADGSDHPPGRDLADHFENIDLKDREGMVGIADRYKRQGRLDGVFTAGTDFSTTVAWVAEQSRLPGIPYAVAQKATDKCLMREAFQQNGVPSPEYTCLCETDKVDRILEKIAFPLVVKPVDSMGARGVKKVETPTQLSEAVKEAITFSRSLRVIVESYMEGPELSFDAIVYRSRVTICGIADRDIRYPPYFVEMGHTMPSSLPAETLQQASRVFIKGVQALGITDGAAKGDIKITPRGAMVGEIAARLSGGYMSGWTFPYSSGIEVTEAALNIAVGDAPGNLEPREFNTSAERALLSIPGVVQSITGDDIARDMAGIRDVFLRVQPGDRVIFPRNNVEKCANVISQSPSRSEAISSAEAAVRSMFVRMVPNDAETEAFLFGDDFRGISAFSLNESANIRCFREMPAYREGNGRIAVIPLPSLDRETAVDWHGTGLSEAYKRVKEITGIHEEESSFSEDYLIGHIFWKALLRGGVQGGLYVVDSVSSVRDRKKTQVSVVA